MQGMRLIVGLRLTGRGKERDWEGFWIPASTGMTEVRVTP
jgi:hypothetical protein